MTGVRVNTESFETACRARFKSCTSLFSMIIASFFAIFYLVTPNRFKKVMRPENSGGLRNSQLYLKAYAYDVCAWHRQVIALWVANEAISAVDENSSFLNLELPRALRRNSY